MFRSGFLVRTLPNKQEPPTGWVTCVKVEDYWADSGRSKIHMNVTHNYTHNPEAVKTGLQVWASALARAYWRSLQDEARQNADG